jgi:hypothetical protein
MNLLTKCIEKSRSNQGRTYAHLPFCLYPDTQSAIPTVSKNKRSEFLSLSTYSEIQPIPPCILMGISPSHILLSLAPSIFPCLYINGIIFAFQNTHLELYIFPRIFFIYLCLLLWIPLLLFFIVFIQSSFSHLTSPLKVLTSMSPMTFTLFNPCINFWFPSYTCGHFSDSTLPLFGSQAAIFLLVVLPSHGHHCHLIAGTVSSF